MALSNYSELQTAIADYIMRSDAPITSFIALAENDVAPRIKHYMLEQTVELTTTSNAVTLPADFKDARRIVVDGLIPRLTSIYDTTRRLDDIGYYQRGNSYVFLPEQDEPREVEITYYGRVAALSDAAPTNWLLTTFPAVLFHASLVRAYRWMKDKDAEAMEKQSLEEALATLAADHNRAVNSGNQFEIDFGGPLF
ncbi:hypothetical protein QM996_02560 [Sinorhizobium chiapasense]